MRQQAFGDTATQTILGLTTGSPWKCRYFSERHQYPPFSINVNIVVPLWDAWFDTEANFCRSEGGESCLMPKATPIVFYKVDSCPFIFWACIIIRVHGVQYTWLNCTSSVLTKIKTTMFRQESYTHWDIFCWHFSSPTLHLLARACTLA